jgi:hypothetical protein
MIKGKIFSAGDASAFFLARDLEGTWVDTMLGKGSSEPTKPMYFRKGIMLHSNPDPTAFNFASDSKIPPSRDAGSVAFSEAGAATLGGSIYEDPDGEEEEDGVTVQDGKTTSGDSAVSLSSDESELWTGQKATPGPIIENLDTMEQTQTEVPFQITTDTPLGKENKITATSAISTTTSTEYQSHQYDGH